MKDPLFDTLAERFADHTMDVDPGTWGAISGKLAVASGSSLSELLQEKFTGHEAPVDPQVWTNISSQLGHGAAAGVGSTAGWWAAGIAATLVVAGAVFYSQQEAPAPEPIAEKALVVAPVTKEEVAEADQTITLPDAPTSQANDAQPAPTEEPRKAGSTVAKAPLGPTRQENSPAVVDPAPSTGSVNDPEATPEGEKTVNTVLQKLVDSYVTSAIVVVTEPKVPAPTQEEMPSAVVHPLHEEPIIEPEPETDLEQEAAVPELSVMIPTAFSPNGDMVNDELEVTVRNYQKAMVRIFSATTDRLVFSADNLEAKWNGQVMNTGDRCDPGMYFYALELSDAQGRTWSKGEVVRLFR